MSVILTSSCLVLWCLKIIPSLFILIYLTYHMFIWHKFDFIPTFPPEIYRKSAGYIKFYSVGIKGFIFIYFTVKNFIYAYHIFVCICISYICIQLLTCPLCLIMTHTTYYVNHWVHLEVQESPCVIMDKSSMGSLSEAPFMKESTYTSFINHQLPVLYYTLCPG